MNPYEEAIKWIEEEVYRNGVFEVKLAETEVMQRNVPVMDGNGRTTIAERCISMQPTGRFTGFTCSSQHTSGDAHNILQLVSEMKRLSQQRCK